MAVSLDGTRIAMGCNEIKILGISYNEEGIPSSNASTHKTGNRS